MNEEIIKNIQAAQDRINTACQRSNRNPGEVKLLLATKTVTPDRIKTALQAGYTLIAENKIQELKEKFEALASIPHENHFIGHLQTRSRTFCGTK